MGSGRDHGRFGVRLREGELEFQRLEGARAEVPGRLKFHAAGFRCCCRGGWRAPRGPFPIFGSHLGVQLFEQLLLL